MLTAEKKPAAPPPMTAIFCRLIVEISSRLSSHAELNIGTMTMQDSHHSLIQNKKFIADGLSLQ
jgi:hypothetical protein